MKTLELKSQIPAWARDLRVNLGNVRCRVRQDIR